MLLAKKNKDILVFLPGWGFSSAIWQEVARQFERTVLLDFPHFSKQLSWEDIAAVLTKQLPERFVLIGWSLGGLLALYLCQLELSKCTGLVLVCTTPKFIAEQDWPGISPREATQFLQSIKRDKKNAIQNFIRSVQYPDHQLKVQSCLTTHFVNTPFEIQNLVAYLHLLFDTDWRSLYRQFTVPMLHVLGAKDAIVPASIAEPLSHERGVIKIIQRAGHALFLTHQYEFVQELCGFLKC